MYYYQACGSIKPKQKLQIVHVVSWLISKMNFNSHFNAEQLMIDGHTGCWCRDRSNVRQPSLQYFTLYLSEYTLNLALAIFRTSPSIKRVHAARWSLWFCVRLVFKCTFTHLCYQRWYSTNRQNWLPWYSGCMYLL